MLQILQSNTLADCYAKDFPTCPGSYLTWNYRKTILEDPADIICLQEATSES